MKLYTYFANVDDHDMSEELRLCSLWRKHHEALGFTPVVLFEYHARQHPFFEAFDAKIGALPSINPGGYDRACFHRWLAMARIGGGVMMDFDTMITPTVTDDLTPLVSEHAGEFEQLHVYQNCVPCLVRGSQAAYLKQCGLFATYAMTAGDTRESRTHVSDMTILEKQLAFWSVQSAFVALPYVKCYGEENWQTAPAVHFSNACTAPAGKAPRWKHVPDLLKEHSAICQKPL